MSSDTMRKRTNEIVELNDNLVAPYSAFFDVFETKEHEDADSDIEVFTPSINAETIDDYTRIVSPYQTEFTHFKLEDRNFTFKRANLMIRYEHSKFHKGDAVNYRNKEVLKRHLIQFDRNAINGSVDEAGNDINTGLLNAVGSITKPSLQLANNTEILKVANATIKEMMNATATDEADYILWVFGKELQDSLAEMSGDNLVEDLFNKKFGNRWGEIPTFINDSFNGFVAFNPSSVILHHTITPEIDDQFYDSKDKSFYTDYMYGLNALEVVIDGGVVIQPVTFA